MIFNKDTEAVQQRKDSLFNGDGTDRYCWGGLEFPPLHFSSYGWTRNKIIKLTQDEINRRKINLIHAHGHNLMLKAENEAPRNV